jgi:Cu-processing system permease protein
MKLPIFLRGMPQVARQEFVGNLKSVRLIVMGLLSALLIVGGSYGFTSLLSSGIEFGGIPPVLAWGHAAYAPNGTHVAVVWVSDPYGAPMSGRSVEFTNRTISGAEVVLGTATTDANGFARLNVGQAEFVSATVHVGTFTSISGASFFSPKDNFTVATFGGDFSRHGVSDGLALSVLDRAGNPVPANVSVNATLVGTVDRNGYLLITLPTGTSTVTVRYAGEAQEFPQIVSGDGGVIPFASGPDFVLAIISSLSFIVISIFAIVLTFDAVSKERVQGTMDLLLSRPSSRTGVLLGKFLGSFGAVAVPITLVNLAGIGMIAAASGKAPSSGFAAAFVGVSLLLIAFYVLIQLIFSTFAKTSGTAMLFGILVWLLLNLLYSIVTNVVGSLLFGGAEQAAAFFRFEQVAGLGNPSAICSMLLSLAAPAGVPGVTSTSLDAATVGAAAVIWFVVLLALALWTFHRRAAE